VLSQPPDMQQTEFEEDPQTVLQEDMQGDRPVKEILPVLPTVEE